MSRIIEVHNQDELAAALIEQARDGVAEVVVQLLGRMSYVVNFKATVRASGQATVRASEQATVRASGNVMVRALHHAHIVATPHVAIYTHGSEVTTEGGISIPAPAITTPQAWCEHYGLSVQPDSTVVLYKGVREDYTSSRGLSYAPGTVPAAPDWDGGREECGGGLHFSPHPWMTKQFIPQPAHYIACPVRLEDIAVHPDGDYPEKVKAKGCAGPVWECDEDGRPIATACAS